MCGFRTTIGIIWVLATACAIEGTAAAEPDGSKIDFNRDIKPILAAHCYRCHGPDEASRQAELRLDDRQQAVAKSAIVPQHPDRSLMVERIHSSDPDTVMPPPEHKRPLNNAQKALLEAWIRMGADYATHWAFVPPDRQVMQVAHPMTHDFGADAISVKDINAIDYFVHQRLKSLKLVPNGRADKSTLLRRVTMDLTGLPPTPEELDAFLNDASDNAYERVVDRLLGSPAYAERMTMDWLDLARYADTNGYNNDEDRTMWPWRDWVIRAFEANMPYDQFLIEQLAGDLLPNATESQIVATGFLRNQGHNTEGGIIQEEYRVEYVADRVHTAATVFLGLSMQCARCHDHKYDPISQQEYYQFYDFFNNIDEKQASYSKFIAAEPFIRVPTPEQRSHLQNLEGRLAESQTKLNDRRANAERLLNEWLATQDAAQLNLRFSHKRLLQADMEKAAEGGAIVDLIQNQATGKFIGPVARTEGKTGQAIHFNGTAHVDFGQAAAFDGKLPFAIGLWVFPESAETMAILSKMDDGKLHRGYDLLMEGGKIVSHLVHQWPDNAIKVATKQPISLNQWHHVVLTYGGGNAETVRIYVDGQSMPLETLNNSLSATIAAENAFHLGLRGSSLPFRGRLDELVVIEGPLFAEQITQWFSGQPLSAIDQWLRQPADQRTEEQTRLLHHLFLTTIDGDAIRLQTEVASLESDIQQWKDGFPAVMVMKEMQPRRETFVLQRGQYDRPGEKVTAGVPTVLAKAVELKAGDRLGLAHWLVSPENPLTARVAVNRWWQHLFGVGLVKTVEDFGVTGEAPSHPELLDYLAISLAENNWNVKALFKQIVLSETYQRDSRIDLAGLQNDPENRWLARGPRHRWPAEVVRDNALAISGLLKQKVGGPSVKPYQPDGLWEDVSVERRAKYVADAGEGLYRRSLYTFWKRTCPPPALMTFDAPNREVCFARRPRTNTPLQSLVMMNDPTYVEAARMLAQQMLQLPSTNVDERIAFGFLRSVARRPTADELNIVKTLLDQALTKYRKRPEDATALNAIGHTRSDEALDKVEVAAWTIVASTLLNLDEVVSKR